MPRQLPQDDVNDPLQPRPGRRSSAATCVLPDALIDISLAEWTNELVQV
jgi:hypothetical protein